MLDRTLLSTTSRICPEAPVPVAVLQEVRDAAGGAGNVAANIAALGGYPALVSIVGKDEAGYAIGSCLQHVPNVWLSLLDHEAVQTTVKMRVVSGGQLLLRVDQERPYYDVIGYSDVQARLVQHLQGTMSESLRLFVISDYGKGMLPQASVDNVVAAARTVGALIFVDCKRELYKYAGVVNLVKLNLQEAMDSVDDACHPGLAADKITQGCTAAHLISQQFGIPTVVVTLGADGVAVSSEGQTWNVPAHTQAVFDVTGAGDTFMAGLAVAFLEGADLRSAVDMANVAAALAVQVHGTTIVTRFAVEQFRRQQREPQFKLATLEEARRFASYCHDAGKKIVFTNGCFDLLHPGHVHVLRTARAAGDVLIVGFNSDESVRQLKGPTRPLIPQGERGLQLCDHHVVDMAVVYDEPSPDRLIRAISPHVLVKGEEYRNTTIPGAEYVASCGGEILLVPMLDWFSTTQLQVRLDGVQTTTTGQAAAS